MNIDEITKLLDARVYFLPGTFDKDITTAGASDLMSDVLAYVVEDILLITGLLSPQVIRVSDLMGISAVLFTRAKRPTEPILTAARETGVAVLSTKHTTFTTCGILHRAGIRGIREDELTGDDDGSK